MTHEQLARRIAEVALLRGEFTLRSGRKSNYYLDKYRFETRPDLLAALGERIAQAVAEFEPEATRLAGPELGAVALEHPTHTVAVGHFRALRQAADPGLAVGGLQTAFPVALLPPPSEVLRARLLISGSADVLQNTLIGVGSGAEGIAFTHLGGPVSGAAFGNTIFVVWVSDRPWRRR